MKLHRLPEYILITTVLLAGMGLALYCGRLIGAGQTKSLLIIFAVLVFLAVGIIGRTHVWVLIPVSWGLTGQIGALGIPFTVRELVIFAVYAMFLGFHALKLLKVKPKFGMLDLLLLLNGIYLIVTFTRNPVGADVLGTDRIGGRPYAIAFIGALAYWVLTRVTMNPKQAGRMPFYMIIGSMTTAILGTITFYVPSTAPFMGKYYSGVNADVYNSQISGNKMVENGLESRQQHLGPLGEDLILAECAWFRPLTLINPLFLFRFVVFCLSVLALLISGHRSMVLPVICYFIMATWVRGRMNDLFKIATVGTVAVGLILAAHGTLFTFPVPVQRALSFLPGNWDPDALKNAADSTEWRVQMWKIALTTDKYIHNKWLGDGFGLSRAQYDAMNWSTDSLSNEAGQEWAMVAGDFHSGPVSAIRFVGVAGLVLYYILIFYMMCYAWRLLRKCSDTPFFPISIFICMPIVLHPFIYTFIFGGFQAALPNALFYAGMLKLIDHSVDVYRLSLNPEDGIPAVAADPQESPSTRRRPMPAGLVAIR